MAATRDLAIDAGTSSAVVTFVWKIDDEPVDLSDWTVRVQVRRYKTDATAVLTLTETSGLEVDGPAGSITLQPGATATATMHGTYYYDVLLTNGAESRRLVEGRFKVAPAVTR